MSNTISWDSAPTQISSSFSNFMFYLPWSSTFRIQSHSYSPCSCWHIWVKCCSPFSILSPSFLSGLIIFLAGLCGQKSYLLVSETGGRMGNNWRKEEAMHLVLQKRGFCIAWKPNTEHQPLIRGLVPFCWPRGSAEPSNPRWFQGVGTECSIAILKVPLFNNNSMSLTKQSCLAWEVNVLCDSVLTYSSALLISGTVNKSLFACFQVGLLFFKLVINHIQPFILFLQYINSPQQHPSNPIVLIITTSLQPLKGLKYYTPAPYPVHSFLKVSHHNHSQ